MFFKFSLSFLICTIAVSCMHTGQPEASGSAVSKEKTVLTPEDLRLIDEAFTNARKSVKVAQKNTSNGCIAADNYYTYMSDNNDEYDFIASYLEDYLEEPESKQFYCIDLPKFRYLFNKHCELLEKPVAVIAEERKAAMETKEKEKGKGNRKTV
ncbi:uncharacterized protein LOC126840022 [Adelges cooleyi]|uniref:uncharacterized protein LOC126840022 n=1 Tax=Adelges cooleyi TaxID=133065 RepID=UPI00217F56BB|nr:uncharacterized protein LOC126840022 [Adelges cooleyi]